MPSFQLGTRGQIDVASQLSSDSLPFVSKNPWPLRERWSSDDWTQFIKSGKLGSASRFEFISQHNHDIKLTASMDWGVYCRNSLLRYHYDYVKRREKFPIAFRVGAHYH